MSTQSLIGAYGMFWHRDSVNWEPGSGPNAWQLLGRLHKYRPALRFCDFRRAQGFYILLDDFGPNYVGLARGAYGIGSRLRAHHQDRTKRWTRFCWFAFDAVRDSGYDGWSELHRRDTVRNVSSETVLRECEALLIAVLGSRQNQMKFMAAHRWNQVTDYDMTPFGLGIKVDRSRFTDPEFSPRPS